MWAWLDIGTVIPSEPRCSGPRHRTAYRTDEWGLP